MASRKRRSNVESPDELSLSQLETALDTYSAQVSAQLRTVNLGTLALVWVLLLKTNDVQALAVRIPAKALLGIALICILSILADLCQYLCGQSSASDAFDRAVESDSKTAGYDADSFAYRAQEWFYRGKLALTAISAVSLIVLIAQALLR